MNANYIMIMCCMTAKRRDVLKKTTMANDRWWKGPGMDALTSTEPVLYWFILAHKPKHLSDPGRDFSSDW
jgi:hypothetical protein